MKIATFNIQNLFHRNRELFQKQNKKNSTDLIDELDRLLRKHTRNADDDARIRDLSFLLGFEKTYEVPYAVLKRQSGELYYKNNGFEKATKASFLSDWEGWVKLGNMPLNDKAIFAKAYVIADTNPDILILQEVEDRASLMEFNRSFLPLLKISPYEEAMVFETNNEHGLSMGVLLKNGFKLNGFRNHVHDLDANGFTLFDIDCQEYSIVTPEGDTINMISNHFSKNAEERKIQAEKVAEIYQAMHDNGKDKIIVCGTLNDVSYSDCLAPLIRDTDLKDASKHQNFKADTDKGKDSSYFRLGAYRMGVNLKQKDYLLLSPHLFENIRKAGINRKGTWRDKKPSWQLYPSIVSKNQAASEHPLIWAEIV
ncbi:hypothetical protein [Zobellia laminariae]|uniref:hypothetical protein n=1 Tax=Zobellia laminariae TaxID=248906 RepID=UPI0026F42F66|nr:hypothetical protein [Zobellia laminariae]WKX76951.1 hypothetical protein Q5W13_01945 [Zobellia laminariae]